MELLVTEITVMNGGSFCVAGWNRALRRMVRPLPDGSNWNQNLLDTHNLQAGSLISVVETGQPHNGSLPHSTEDTRIYTNQIENLGVLEDCWFGPNAPLLMHTLQQAFGNELAIRDGRFQNAVKCYVADRTRTNSLAGIQLPANSVQFFEDNFQGNRSLHVRVSDADDCYNLKVSSKRLRQIFDENGVNGIVDYVPSDRQLHLRVGLARAMNGTCAVMLNGIQW
jgi:hypothetical protein